MKNYKFYFCNASPTFTTTALVSAYNVHTYGQYKNIFPQNIEKQEEMFCMLFSLAGNAEVHLKNGTVFKLPTKCVLFAPYSDIKGLFSDSGHWQHTCSWFIPQGISLPLNKVIEIPDLDVDKENEETNFIIRLFQTQRSHNIKYANSYFCCHLLKILEKIQPHMLLNNSFINDALIYINRNIESAITVKGLAEHFHYSEKHIHHLFKTSLNISPKQFINNIKLSNISHLLTTTQIPLQELAFQYNFSSVSHLINSFKKKYGVTPSAYREAYNTDK